MSPYTPPPPPQQPYYGYGYPPPPDLLRPARWAAGLMFLMGGLLILLGGCLGVIGNSSAVNQMPPQHEQMLRQLETESGAGRSVILTVAGLMILTPGVVMILLAFFVRKGGRGSIITSLVLVGLVTLWLLLNLAQALRAGPGADKILTLGMLIFSFVIVGMLIYNLSAALKNAGQLTQQQQQYANQWWQYQQQQHQQQMYQQQPPPPPPPFQPPPPPPPAQ